MTLRTIVRRRAVEPAGTPAGTDARRSGRRRDGGFSLVEIVITITLMGVVVAPILVAVAASIRASTVSLSSAEVETVLVNAVDRVNRATRARFPCDLTSPVVAAVETHGWSPSSATVGHEYLDTSGAWQSDAGGTACPAGIPQNGLIQRITVTITSPDADVSRTLQVVRGGDE
jgi:prepilin-type N-terminal cleavage/methylation domain-containing protein